MKPGTKSSPVLGHTAPVYSHLSQNQACFIQAQNEPLVQKWVSQTPCLFLAPDKDAVEQAWFNSSAVAIPD